MSYLVLARKYRPKRFSEVVGQEHITKTIQNAIRKGRIHHAFLFAGSRGIGKTTTARILARALNCENGPIPEPCGICNNCIQIMEGRSVDVQEIDGASHNSVEHVRELRESVGYLPVSSRYKIYIIDEVHMLSISAFNALLKTLEEPPSHVVFIFATTEIQKIPATILSRCQKHFFKSIPPKTIADNLSVIFEKEGIEIEKQALFTIARQARGSMRDALSIAEQVIAYCEPPISNNEVQQLLGLPPIETVFEVLNSIRSHDETAVVRIIDEYERRGFDIINLAHELLARIRDLLVLKVTQDEKLIEDLSLEEITILKDISKDFEAEQLKVIFNMFSKSVDQLPRSSFPKYLLEVILLQLATLPKLKSLDLLIKRLEELELSFKGMNPNRLCKDDEKTSNYTSPNEENTLQADTQKRVSGFKELIDEISNINTFFGGILSNVVCGEIDNDNKKVIIRVEDFVARKLKEKLTEFYEILKQLGYVGYKVEIEIVKKEKERGGVTISKEAEEKEKKRKEIINHPLIKEAVSLFGIEEKDIVIRNTK